VLPKPQEGAGPPAARLAPFCAKGPGKKAQEKMNHGKPGWAMRLLIEKIQNLRSFYIHEVRMLLSAEEQIVAGLEKMEEAATDVQLQQAFRSHRQESQVHAMRLERILNHTAGDTDERKCKAVTGLIKEGDEVIQECDGTLRDVALIAVAQRIEHYEMAAYGALRNFARVIELAGDAEELDQTLHEEAHADALLTNISDRLNSEALKLP
jgi:ferritin-like metal-binding protein YciE